MRLADLLLDFAARRWPADIRAEQRKEWEAEMHAIRHDPSTGGLLRALRPLPFAFSLAASPPADDGHGVPRGWRELVPEHGRRLTPVLLLVVATAVAAALGSVLPGLVYRLNDGSITFTDDYPVQSAEAIWTVGVTVVLMTAALAVAGVWLAARFAMPSAFKAFGVVTGTLLAMSLAAPDWPGYLRPQIIATPFTGAVMITAWGAALFAVTAVATRLLGKRTWAALAVSAGALVVLDLIAVAFAAPVLAAGDTPLRTFPEALHGLLWFPLSLVSTGIGVSGNEADDGLATLLNPWMSVLLAVTAFAVAYVLRSRRGGKAVAPEPAVGRASQPLAPLRWTAGALGTVAFGTWVWTLTVVTPAGSATWIVEARLTAVLATVLAGAVVLTGRGRPLLAAVIAAPALVAADLVLDGLGVRGPIGAVQVAGVGAVLLAGAWRLSERILPGPGEETARPLAFVAVLGALSLTGLYGSAQTEVPHDATVWDYPPPIVIVSVVLVALSGVAALGARRRGVVIALAVAGLVVRVVLVTAALGLTAGLGFGLAVAPVLAMWTLATIRWDGGMRTTPRWAVALAGAALAAIPIVVITTALTEAFYSTVVGVDAGRDFGGESVGEVLMPAVTLLGAAVAWLVTAFGVDGAASATAPEPGEPGHEGLRGGGVAGPVLP